MTATEADLSNPLIRKLEQFTRLSALDREVLTRAASTKIRRLSARQDVIREGEKPEEVNLMLAGWACRYKQLEDGRRQIVAFFLPGDLCDLNLFILRGMDHSVGTVTPVTVASLSHSILEEITENYPRVTQALWWETLVNAAIQREWTLSLGQRSAPERLAHLFCELYLRLRGVGLVRDGTCELPLTQAELGEATGLSSVHVNRTLQDLRAAGRIRLKGRMLTVPDLPALMNIALFNPNYLHLGREGQHLDANEEAA